MASADLSLVQQWVGLEVTRELYDRVRSLWAHHCDRENNGDIDGILTTLTEDCEYHVVNIGKRWRGHAGAREFYQEPSGRSRTSSGFPRSSSSAPKASSTSSC